MSHKTEILQVPDFDTLPDTAFIRLKQLVLIASMSSSTVWRKVNTGQFPAPVKISSGITAWRVGMVRAWLHNPQAFKAAQFDK